MDSSNLDVMITYFRNLFIYNKIKKDFQQAVLYADSLQKYEVRFAKVIDKRILDQAEMRVQVAKYNTDVQKLQSARSRQILMRNALFVILILLGLVGFLWYKRQELKRKSELKKLEQAQNELTRFTRSMIEKNELIQSFKEQLE